MENDSRINEAKYRAILDSTVDGIITIDEFGCITSFNPSAEQIFGYPAAEIIGRNVSVLMPEPYRSGHDRYLNQYISTHDAKIIGIGREVQGLRKDGSVFDMYLAVSDVAVSGQRMFTGIVRNITDLKQAQAALQVSEERLRRSQRFANIGTWDWNIRTGELFWSERIATLFGYPEGVLETTYENFLNAVHPDDRQQVIDAVNHCVDLGEEYHIEHRCVWPNGEVRWLLERGDTIRDQNGKPLHMLGVVQDISARKRAEIALQEAKEEAERANYAKSEFLSSMSHELRTPLNAVLGFAQLLEYDEDLNAVQRESVGEIQLAGNHLLELINEVLDLAKIESGHVTLTLEPVSLSKVINECCALTQSIAHRRGIKVNCNRILGNSGGTFSGHKFFDEHSKGEVFNELNRADRFYIFADYIRLKQVILNLLSNAVKYNRNNGSVDLRFSETAQGRVRVEVRDTGYGIPEEKLQQLFQPFNRLGAETGNIEGTGIGLVITKRYVEMMSGIIGVESQPGEGSTFWIELPQADQPRKNSPSLVSLPLVKSGAVSGAGTDQPGGEPEPAPSIPFSAPAGQRGRGVKLLVVEDNLTNQLILENQLIILGYEADIASNAKQGFELFNRNSYAAILTDINLPDFDGIELTRIIRHSKKSSAGHIPIIAVTANALHGEAEMCLSHGLDDYISKPVDLRKLKQILDKHTAEYDPGLTEPPVELPQNFSEKKPLVDVNVLRKLLGNNIHIEQKILRSFSENSRQIVNHLHDAFASRSVEDIIWHTHKLKSSSHSIGAIQLGECCEALESAARGDDWQNIELMHDEVEQLFASVVDYIQHYKARKSGSTE